MKFRLLPIVVLTFLLPASLPAAPEPPVVVSENENTFILANGPVTAQIDRRSGDLASLKYNGLEMLSTSGNRSAPGYWSHNPARGLVTDRITIDPKTNGGARGEVSIKGVSHGNQMGGGPGGGVIADIEIRYTLARGDAGLYTYSIFTHPADYSETSIGEARFCLKLNDDVFDWMTIDSNRNLKMISAYDWNHGTQMNMKEARRMNSGIYPGRVEHKYDYSANQFDVRAWGWSSSAQHVGLWLLNPSVEYLSGGPTKFELSAHRDATFTVGDFNTPAPPTLLNYWRGSHYGGSVCDIGRGEKWTKVIGPFLIYCNSGPTPDAMWKNALAGADTESTAWPFDWVEAAGYPHKDQRAVVSGKIVLHDPPMPGLPFSKLLVGLSAPDYTPPRISGDSQPRTVDWQNDAKNYEFWAHADANGDFSIPNVRAGTYSLHTIADGVLGDLTVSNVIVESGKDLALGTVDWRPVRYGRQLWDIGIPNRDGSEFFKGNDYFHWGWYLEYPKLFPHDVSYVIGRSDFHTDWFFEQVPRNENPANTTGAGRGRATTWTISCNRPDAVRGRATLRLAICGVGTRSLSATLNNRSIGNVTGLTYNATINRDGIGGYWTEHDLTFDASLMKVGDNILKLTVPAGSLVDGVIYDYIRLELDETATAAN